MTKDPQAVPAQEALERLQKGNQRFLDALRPSGDISPELRRDTCENGQHPYAIVIACSDSRVVPEHIFDAGIGELFVIRIAGNVIDAHQLGSIEYAAQHLGCRLILVMGHTHCGAVEAAICHNPDGYIRFITDEIRAAIGGEKDEEKASRLNVRHSVSIIESSLVIHQEEETHRLCVRGALYHPASGRVEFLDDSDEKEKKDPNAGMDFAPLLESLIGVIQEFHLKLGYEKKEIGLYYPLDSLNRLLDRTLTPQEMDRALAAFADGEKDRLGPLQISRKGDRYCIRVPETGAAYVHDHVEKPKFLTAFLKTLERKDLAFSDIRAVFERFSNQVRWKEADHEQFDYLFWFADDKPDAYRYCVRFEEDGHTSYHRFTQKEYDARA